MEELYTKSLDLRGLNEERLNEAVEILMKTKTIGELILCCNLSLRKFGNQLAAAVKVNQSITHLNLSNTVINDEVASALSEQEMITHLDLAHCRFTARCLDDIIKNKNLQYLNLFSAVVQYRTLNLTEYSRDNVSEETFPRESHDIITVVAAFLQKTTSLKCLNFSNNLITCNPQKKIFKALLINRSLTDLNIASNSISIACIRELTEMLKHNKTLERLDLSKNRLNSAAMKEVAQALLQNQTLTDINLSFNPISPGENTREFVTLFLQNKNLSALNLCNNQLGDDALREIAAQLEQTKLTKLSIADNMGLSLINRFAFLLSQNNTLSSLSLGINQYDNEIQGWGSFTVDNRGFGPFAVKEITNALMKNEVITFLDFSFYFMGPDGAKDVAELLKHNKTITDLKVRYNRLGNEGVAYIASGLAVNKSLLNLDIEFNDIGNDGAVALWKALKVNRTLTNLNVSFNPSRDLSEIGVNDLIDVLRCNNVLNALSVGGCELDMSIELVIEALKENTTMLSFHLLDPEQYDIPPPLDFQFYLERNRNLLRKISFIAKYVYNHRTEKELILNLLSKKDFEGFETYPGRRDIIKMLCESDFCALEAAKAIESVHFFIKNNFFEIAGILEDPFDSLPLDILCKIASFLKLKDVRE